MQTWKGAGEGSIDQATARRVPLAGRPSPTPTSTLSTLSTPPSKAKETFDSWGTKDDAGTLTTSAVRLIVCHDKSHVIETEPCHGRMGA